MKKKNILLNFLFIFLLSLYNVLFKYIIFTENITRFNSSSFGSAFITTSIVKPPYLKIFLFSFLCILTMEILLIFSLFYISKKKIKKYVIFNNLSIYLPLIVSIIVSSGLLFLNKIFGLIVLFIGLIVYLFFIYKKMSDKKLFIVTLVFILLMIYLLYFISS